MVYRPRIPDDVHKRVEHHTVGRRIRDNQVYINAIEILYSEDGSNHEWIDRLNMYCDKSDMTQQEAMSKIVKAVIDDNGEADIQFKESIGL
jgi:hypothetical protein